MIENSLRFGVPGLSGSITSATLRIFANTGPSVAYDVYVLTDNTSATLSLWTSNDLSDNDRTIRVYRLKTAFDESSATWNESASGVNWQSAGASGTNDRESTDIGSVLVLANEADGTEKQISLDTTKLQEMVSGTFTNHGFIIIADTELNDRFNYKSSDASTSSQRPKLVIQYTTSTPTPDPSPTPTNTPVGPTATPTRTPTPGASNTPTPTAPPAFQNATFVYDGDGKRVKSIFNGTMTTYFVGAHFELNGSTVTKYYYAGSQRIAMRSGTWDFSNPVTGTLNFLLGDHLGSTSLTTDAAGDIVSEIRYKAWGTVRYATEGVSTKYQYTGQYSYEAEFGLYFYNARWYDPYLNHFTQPDSIVPDPSNPQAWDRYAYALNNPVRYTDPSGHIACDDQDKNGNCINYAQQNRRLYSKLVSNGTFESVPDIDDIEWNENYGPIEHLEGALNQYERLRRELFITYGFQYVDEHGKIDDEVIMSLIIGTEFPDNPNSSIYKETLEALSNQYHSVKNPNSGPMQCNGNCSITTQILWASQMEGIYNRETLVQDLVANGGFIPHLPDARSAAAGFSVGVDDSWFWGNVAQSQLDDFSLVDKIRRPMNYPGLPFFIVFR